MRFPDDAGRFALEAIVDDLVKNGRNLIDPQDTPLMKICIPDGVDEIV